MKAIAKIMGAAAVMLGAAAMAQAQTPACDSACNLRFNPDGQFKILQITDLHYQHGNEKTIRSIQAVKDLIGFENPDLIIVTGDIIDPPIEQSLRTILEPFEASGIPYALTYGNHDGGPEGRPAMASVAREAKNCLNRYFPEPGAGYGLITLASHDGDSLVRAIFLLDSGGKLPEGRLKGFDHVRPEKIAWYRSMSDSLASARGGEPVPALMFYHIPLPELKAAVAEGEITGTRTWGEVTPALSNGLFLAAVEQGDVDGMFFGHDHGNDYSVLHQGILMAYGHYTGCVERIGGLSPQGARVITLAEGEPGFKTYIRLMDGTIQQAE